MAKKRLTQLQVLERRHWQLILITLILLITLAAFIILVYFYWGSTELGETALDTYEGNIFLLGFAAFILLFSGYMIVKEFEIKNLKHVLVENQIRIQTLREFDEMKTDLISVVSHELRSPLTSVKNAVDIIMGGKTGEVNENQRKFLDIATRNINRLMALITDLLDVSKIEAGKMKLMFTCLDLNEPVDGAINSIKVRAENKSITIYKEVTCETPLVHGDSDKLEQVFVNLIDNAIKFTNEGGEIHVTLRDFVNEKSGGEKYVECIVEDNGIGIEPDHLDRIFDRFYQVEKSLSTTSRQGTGLGLAIIKGLIEGHRGKIWVESQPGKGTKFTFILPQYNSQRIMTDLVDNAIIRARDNKTIFSLMMVRLENFEYLKKTFGNKETFKLMDQVCRIVYDSIRKERDTLEYQRLDGRIILILHDTPKEGCTVVDNRIRDQFIKNRFATDRKSSKTCLALGAATYPEEGTTGEVLIKKVMEI